MDLDHFCFMKRGYDCLETRQTKRKTRENKIIFYITEIYDELLADIFTVVLETMLIWP